MTIDYNLQNEVAPTILRKPRIREEDDGNRLLFECQLISNPIPTVKWYKENRQITDYDRRISMHLKELLPNRYLATLDINDVVGPDAGIYRIHAVNMLGDVSASLSLNFTPSGQPHEEQIDGAAPTFFQKPSIKQEDDGRILIFECKIKADPKPNVSWYHNNTLVEPKGRYKVTTVKESGTSYIATMEITDVAVEDAGKYRVIAKNELGESNASISLNFDSDDTNIPAGEAKPTFTEKPVIKQLDGKIIFECRLVANPKPQIKWFHKNNLVKEDSRHKYNLTSDKHNHFATLEITGIVENESGQYKLVASNSHGEDEATINLNFDQGKPNIPDGKPPRFPKKPTISQVKGSLLLQCYLEANPFPEIAWFHGSTKVQNSTRHKISDQSVGKDAYLLQLEIKNPVNEDGGTYRCNACNGLGESNANIALNFQGNDADNDSDNAPKFITKPKIIPKDDGNLILMECKVKSSEKITVTWYKGSTVVRETSKIKQVVKSEGKDEHLVYLEIKTPTAAEGGQYKCNVKNSKGEINANLTLNIEGDDEEDDSGEPPTFVEKPRIIAENDGKLIKMECKIRSVTKPTIVWTCDGEKIVEGGRIQKILREESSNVYHMKLELRNPILTDAGMYKCNVRNDHGECNANLKLNIELAPVIKEKPKIIKQQKSVIIEVIVESGAPPKVSWMKETTAIREDSRRTVYVKEKKKGEFIVGLEINPPEISDKGSYKVIAKNEKGECQSLSVRVDDIQEEKKKDEDKKKEEEKKKTEEKKKEEEKKKDELKEEDKKIDKKPSVKKPSVKEPTEPESKESQKIPSKRPSVSTRTEPPMFIYQLKSLTVDEGANAKLSCQWESKEKVTSIQWFYERKEIRQSSMYSIINKESSAELIVNNCVHESTGEYSISVTNKGGTSESSALLTVKAKVEKVGIDRKKRQSVLQQKDTNEEDKKKKSIDESKPIKKSSIPQINEPEDEKKLGKGVPQIQEPNEKAQENPPRGGRRGSFFDVNQVSQRRGSFNPSDRRDSKTEFDPTDKSSTPLKASSNELPARIFNYQENQQCTEGKTAFIQFDVEGNPVPSLRFFKDGQEIYASGRYTLVTDGSSNTVYFCVKKSKPNDEGRYKVIAENRLGQSEAEIGLFIGGEEGVDFRAMLKRGRTSKWAKKDEDPDWGNLKAVEDERRASLKEMQKPQVFSKPLQNQRCKEGRDKKVRFDCVFSRIGVKAKWYKNKVELFPGKRYQMSTQGDLQVLEIMGPVVADEGKYMCQCLDTKTEALLEVDPPDPVYKFTKKLNRDSKGYVGTETILECVCNSSKAPVKWFRGDEKLENGVKYLIESETSGRKILRILNSTEADSGTYSCKITTNQETTTTKCTVVEPSYKFMRVLRSMRINETEKILLECELDDGSAEVVWYKNGKEITKDKHVDIQKDGKKRRLIIKKAKCDDEAKYLCKAKGDETECEVLVEPLNRFKKKLKDVRTFENKKIVLDVELTDNRAQLKWLRNGKEIRPGTEGVTFKFHDDKHMLIIESCNVQDAGEYTAMINENIKSMCKVIVDENERPPAIKLDQNDFIGHEDKPFNIEIPYTVPGTRLSDVTAKLLKNGVPVSSKDIDVQIKQDKVVISFKKPQRNQSGNFKFQLTNGTGSSDLIPINVNILGKPSSPEGPLVASDVKETGLKLAWKPPADDGGAGNLIYDVEKMDVQTGRWVKVGETRDTNFEVSGLTKGKKYKFRVKAKNKEGESEPLETDGDIIAKNPYDVPAKVNSISVKDYDFSHVDLEWTIPDDGGAAIESFVVEYREKYSPDWKKGVEVGPKQTTGRVSDLKDGKTYEFRVKAKNKAGEGEPSDPTGPVLVKHKNLKPFLTGDGLKNLVVKKGAIIKYEIKFRGEPAPEVTWILNNQELKPSSKVSIESTANSTIITVKNAVRADSGTYKLVLSNASGKCESVADVIVLDKPSPPEGPLVLEEVRAQHVKIKWRKPKDDGGQKLKGYVIKKMDLDTGKWVPVAEVGADVTDFKIEGLTKNKKYKFRVCAVNKDGESEPLESDHAVEAKNPFEAPSKIASVEIKDYDVSFVDLKWEAPKSEAPVENYIVEMKGKSGIWEQVAQTNGPSTEVKVDGLTENDVVQFRVIAENEWGQSEPSDPTSPHIVKYKNLKPSIDRTYLTDKVVKVGQSVKYEAKVKGEPCPTVVWKLGDKELKDDENIKITNKDYHTIIEIKDIQRLHNGALKCFATNINGQDVANINLTVLGKPSRPNNLEVSDIHKTGCKLKWDKCPDDGGCDVTYEVMKLNEETGRWTKCGDCKGTEFEVKGLSPGKKYKFRVIAVNKEGESEPLETDHSIVAKSPYDPPSKVKNVEIKDYDVSHVDLKWEEPKTQAPILNYFIEMKGKTGDWVQVGQTDGPATEFKVKNLVENDVVEFRVIAENDGGLSEPSDPTSAHTVKHKNLKPSIDRTYLIDKNLKVGQSAKFEAKVKGEPCPTVVWMLGDKELKNDDNVKITNTDYHTIIEFKNVQRAHNGELKCVATNINGIDTAVINFEVQGKPSKPENLEVSDIHDTGCKLSWDKSPDDGGSDVIYEVMKLNEETGRWTRCGQTDSTDFEVKGLIPGKKFKFRVIAVNKTGDSEPLETEHSIIAKNPYDVPSKVKNVAIKDYDFDHVVLDWSNPNDGGAPLESFVIEYKEKFSGNWKKALEVPAGNTTAKVPGLKEGQSYEFRVKAKNKAGEGEPSDPTDSIVIKHKNLKPWIDRTYLVDKTVKVGQTIKLEAVVKGEPCPKVVWTFGDSNKELTDNEHVRITNSEYFTEIEIKDIQRFHNGPLKCTATNINGSDSVTIQLTVQDVPSKPQDLVVSDVTAETCKLSWKPSPDDGGCKTDHYEISKLENGRWIKCGNSNGCDFEVKTLIPGNEYKFRVVAVNKIGDSEPLDTDHAIVAKDLFTLPGKPGKPEITAYDNESVSLNWEPSASNGTNITGYIVEMKTKYGSDWVKCGKSIGASPEANITGLKEGAEVQFRVKAVNKAGVGKPSEPTGMHLVKHSSLKPHIDRTNLVNVTIKEGKSWHVDANVTGEPAPKVEWFFGNSDVSLITDAFYSIRNRDYHTDFTLDNAQRKHRGEYKVTATNSSGFDSVTIVLDVIGKPGAPEGPLFINEVTGDGCKLRWDKPVDDGGSPISHYEVFALDCETNLWTKCGNAPSENYKVTGLTTNKEYKFKVVAVNSEGNSEPLESMHSIVAKNQFDVPSKPSKPIIKDFDKTYADLKWLPPFDDKNSKILGYIIYKKEKNSSNWRKATEIQGDVCEGRVPDLVENSEYEFRVVALNAAGQSPPSDSSELFTARSKNVPPKISGSTAELFLTVGDLLSLDFRLYGSPNPTVNWTFNNIPINNDENYNIDSNQDRTVLRVRNVKREDSGVYRLQAKNSNGTDELTVKVNVIEPPSPPGVPDVTEVGGDFVNLQWEKPKSDGGSRILGYWAEKRERGMEAWQRINSLVCHALQVNAPHLIEDREYEFRIFAFNKAGMSKPSQASKMIKIKDPQASKPPEFITPLRNVFAIENKSCEFSCTVANAADVTWYKGSRELSEGGKYTMLQEGEMYTLSIRDVYGEDQDEYSVRATNKAGSRSSRADLKIKSPPKLNVPPRFRDLAFFERGENCVIKIPFTGFPKPSIKWSKEGEEIEVGDHFEMEVKERHAVLVIKDASRLDDGPYRIFAENELGSDSAIINVKISDRPDPPRLPMVEVIGDTFVNLSWKAPIWNGGSAITNYVILKRSTNMDTWIRCANTRYLLHQVTGLSPERDYEFCVCAENIYGRSDPSEITNKITTRPNESDKQKKKHWNFDADGKKVRGIDDGDTKDYDRLVTPINKIPAIPVDIKTSSVYDQYEILEEIGTGIYGVVHRCRDKRTGHFFMAKFIPATHPFEKSVIRKEIDLMNQLHHNNILRLHDAFEDEDEMIMIYEFVSGEELFERAAKEDYHMSEEQVVNYMRQICNAVRFMHERNIIHLDLKPECFLLNSSKTDEIKLVDFGLASKLDPHEMVKISTGTAEFAAPEIIDKQSVGFYTDMWAVGVLAFTLLCGKSPFASSNLSETLNRIRNGTWSFDSHSVFQNISDEGKDFITKLLQVKKDKRMTAHECLLHSWLKQDQGKASKDKISSSNYIGVRDAMRSRYSDYWNRVRVPTGHTSNYSALRKLRDELKFLHDVCIDRRELAPRFVVRPVSTFAYEGQAAKFYCRVLSPAAPAIISWNRDNSELKQSVKYMKRYAGTEFTFIINRAKTTDRGEYIIRAENHYGWREEPVFLNVHPKPTQMPSVEPLPEPRRSRRGPRPPVWLNEPPSAPTFTFQLRPRVIQVGIGVKLLGCIKSNPSCDVIWRKDGRVLSKSEYTQTNKDGVVTLEITSCTLDDAGKYTCVAENMLGTSESTCVVIVDKKF